MKIKELDREINLLISNSFEDLIFRNSDYSDIFLGKLTEKEREKKLTLLFECFKAGFLSAYMSSK